MLIGAVGLDRSVFTEHLKWLIFLGIAVASIETIWRMREGFQGLPQERVVYRAAMYGLPMGPLAMPVVRLVENRQQQGNGRARRLHRSALRRASWSASGVTARCTA